MSMQMLSDKSYKYLPIVLRNYNGFESVDENHRVYARGNDHFVILTRCVLLFLGVDRETVLKIVSDLKQVEIDLPFDRLVEHNSAIRSLRDKIVSDSEALNTLEFPQFQAVLEKVRQAARLDFSALRADEAEAQMRWLPVKPGNKQTVDNPYWAVQCQTCDGQGDRCWVCDACDWLCDSCNLCDAGDPCSPSDLCDFCNLLDA